MKKKITESEYMPEIKVGDEVFVKWTNNHNYKGIVKKKLRKNWGVEIKDDDWHYSSNLTSVPEYVLHKRF
jgi:hypothetical protein|tara:strand:- start:1154 stop:1363 length:210 start_codon:yes stop_codon:yes gene_type:complete